jgi:lysozyme
MSNTLGNDVSKFQGNIDYDVYRNNSQFVICKASEGVGFKDPTLDRNKNEARRVGLLLGYYHFARPDLGNTPQKEAEWFLQAIGDFRDGELLALDYEPNWNGDAVGWCKAFLDHLSSKLNGYKPLIYMDQSRVSKYDWKPLVDASYGLWIAAYTYDPNNNNFKKGAWKFAAMQQWTNAQQVPGVSTVTDGNVFFGDLSTLKRYCYKSPAPVDPCADLKKKVDEMQKQINDLNSKHTILVNAIKSLPL